MRLNDIVRIAEGRLRHFLEKPTGSYVRWVIGEPEKGAMHREEEGLWLELSPPSPTPRSGGGRLAYKAVRRLSVGVVSKTTLDVAGQATASTIKHGDLEDAVVDALLDGRPQTPANLLDLGFCCTHVPGESTRRRYDADSRLVESVLAFDIEYTEALTSRR